MVAKAKKMEVIKIGGIEALQCSRSFDLVIAGSGLS